jgi:glycosyltransferase involved in cell wall biosynthesis
MSFIQRLKSAFGSPQISLFHEFHKPPYGGGNQFLLALEKELRRRGLSVGRNKIGAETQVCLFNSYNFDFEKLTDLKKRYSPMMVHRVDGPISSYRGEGDEIDRRISSINHDIADKTIFQSTYSLQKHLEMGLGFKDPVVITNAPDPEIFHTKGRVSLPEGKRRIRLIATSWSDNPKKGGPLLSWLDQHLDASRYELTFVGRTKASLKNAQVIAPVPSEELAAILRQHDIYIAASEDDPCSNALVEALSCGLPAAYRRSGGHPELVGRGGEGFDGESGIIASIDKIAADYKAYQESIPDHSLSKAVDAYIKAFSL